MNSLWEYMLWSTESHPYNEMGFMYMSLSWTYDGRSHCCAAFGTSSPSICYIYFNSMWTWQQLINYFTSVPKHISFWLFGQRPQLDKGRWYKCFYHKYHMVKSLSYIFHYVSKEYSCSSFLMVQGVPFAMKVLSH